MREYKFRGKRLKELSDLYRYQSDDPMWAIGSLVVDKDGRHMILNDHGGFRTIDEVDPDTVGQYTGKKDDEGTEMFDGDELWAPGNLGSDLQYVGEIEWDEADARWEVSNLHGRFEYIPNGCVVRNDTPHLLQEQGEKDL